MQTAEENKAWPGYFKIEGEMPFFSPPACDASLIEEDVKYWSVTALDSYTSACFVAFMKHFEESAKENELNSFSPYPPFPFRPKPDAVLFTTNTWYYTEETINAHGREVWRIVFKHVQDDLKGKSLMRLCVHP